MVREKADGRRKLVEFVLSGKLYVLLEIVSVIVFIYFILMRKICDEKSDFFRVNFFPEKLGVCSISEVANLYICALIRPVFALFAVQYLYLSVVSFVRYDMLSAVTTLQLIQYYFQYGERLC